MKTAKAIEKLAMQLLAARSTIKRFQEDEKEIVAELRPHLVLDEPLVFSGIKCELISVPGYSVPGYAVPTGERINVGKAPGLAAAVPGS